MPRPSVRESKIVDEVNLVLPVFVTTIVYSMISPTPLSPSPFTSLTVAVLTIVIDEILLISIIVGSSSVFPSVSSPSSEVSETIPLDPLAETKNWLINIPSSTSSCAIVYSNSYSTFAPGDNAVDSPGIGT